MPPTAAVPAGAALLALRTPAALIAGRPRSIAALTVTRLRLILMCSAAESHRSVEGPLRAARAAPAAAVAGIAAAWLPHRQLGTLAFRRLTLRTRQRRADQSTMYRTFVFAILRERSIFMRGHLGRFDMFLSRNGFDWQLGEGCFFSLILLFVLGHIGRCRGGERFFLADRRGVSGPA